MSAPVSVTVTTSATQILAPNTARQGFIINNTDASASIFIGEDATVTDANGIALFALGTLGADRGFGLYTGAIFAIVSSGTVDVRVWEITRAG